MGHALFRAESFGGWDGDGVAGGQQAGEECAESEERGGCEQTACGKGALHPVGEEGAEKAVKGKPDDNARGRADERDARGDPQDVRARRAERQADAELRSALRDAVSDDAEDADQRSRDRTVCDANVTYSVHSPQLLKLFICFRAGLCCLFC